MYEQKTAAISCYKSQFDEQRLARLLHRIRARDANDGARAGFEYGELFSLPHPVPLKDPFAQFAGLGPITLPAYPPRSG